MFKSLFFFSHLHSPPLPFFNFLFFFSSSLLQFPLLHFLLFILILFVFHIVFFLFLPSLSYTLSPSSVFYFHCTFPSSPFTLLLLPHLFSFLSSSLSFFSSSSFILSLFFFFLT
jgi:hypothetical protein